MFITRLRLRNYCQHADLDESFTGNLVAVIGRNGTGKSNLLGSLSFAFTGGVPEVDKSSLLTDGATEGSVTVNFVHGGASFQIDRRLDKPEAVLLAGEAPLATGVKAVNAALAELLGLDNDIARHSVFVRQAELNDIIFTEAAVRERAWQAMVGLGSAAKVHAKIGECMADIPAYKDYGPLLGETATTLETERGGYAAAKRAYQECRARLCALGPMPDMAEVAKLQELQSVATTEAELLAHQPQLKYTLDTHSKQMLAATTNETAMAAISSEDLATLQDQLTRARQSLANAEIRDEFARFLGALQAKLVNLQGLVPKIDPEALTSQINQATTVIGSRIGECDMCMNLHSALSRSPAAGAMTVCPVCDSQLTDPRQAIDRMADRMTRLRTELAGMDGVKLELLHELDGYKRAQAAVTTCENECANVASRLAAAEQQTDPSVTAQTVLDLESRMACARKTAEARKAAERAVADIRTELTIATSRLEENVKAVQAVYRRRVVLESELRVPAGLVAEKLGGLSLSMNAHINAKDALAVESAKLSTARAMVRRLVATLRKLRKEDSAQAGLRELMKTVESVRNWFHFSQGPRMVVMDILDQLTPDVNALLAKFGSPYTVVPDYDAMLFRYIKGTGATAAEPRSVLRLSGGERVMLATSFRIASYCMFAAKLGLLTLDEPTAYLDSQNVQLFAHMVEKLRELTASLNIQLFMSTHEETIIPLCDTVINLNQTTTEQKD